MTITCEHCDTEFEKTNKRGPNPRYCKDSCKLAAHRAKKGQPDKPSKPKVASKPKAGLTLRDVINVAELDLSVKQCDVILNAFTKARLRAAKRERG